MTTQRWFWPGILLIPGIGLGVQEILSFRAVYLGEDGGDRLLTGLGWGLWVAAPYLAVALQMGIAVGRSRLAWWLSLAAGLGVTTLGLGFAVTASLDQSGDPLAGLTWILAPMAQLGLALSLGAVVAVLALTGRLSHPVASADVSRNWRTG